MNSSCSNKHKLPFTINQWLQEYNKVFSTNCPTKWEEAYSQLLQWAVDCRDLHGAMKATVPLLHCILSFNSINNDLPHLLCGPSSKKFSTNFESISSICSNAIVKFINFTLLKNKRIDREDSETLNTLASENGMPPQFVLTRNEIIHGLRELHSQEMIQIVIDMLAWTRKYFWHDVYGQLANSSDESLLADLVLVKKKVQQTHADDTKGEGTHSPFTKSKNSCTRPPDSSCNILGYCIVGQTNKKILVSLSNTHNRLVVEGNYYLLCVHGAVSVLGYTLQPKKKIPVFSTGLQSLITVTADFDGARKSVKISSKDINAIKSAYFLTDKQISGLQLIEISPDSTDVLLEVTSGSSLKACKDTMTELVRACLSVTPKGEGGGAVLALQQVRVVDETGSLRCVFPAKDDLRELENLTIVRPH